jgi:hypothetical protein
MTSKPSVPSKNTGQSSDKVRKPRESVSEDRPKGKYTEKYKYVRFVEKKKVLRKMRQLQKQLLEGSDESRGAIEASLGELRKDLMYIEKFPGKEKYIALFPSEGQLSDECVKKQKAIRDMIVNVTRLKEKNSEKRKFDAVRNDDFFASVDNVEKPSREKNQTHMKKQRTTTTQEKPVSKPTGVHPSWEAKKQNEKLTGSLSQTKFEGSRVVFDED